MFEEVYKHFRLSHHIISNHDVLFTSTFQKRLHELLGTNLDMSCAYHPKLDGSTECADRTVIRMVLASIDKPEFNISRIKALFCGLWVA